MATLTFGTLDLLSGTAAAGGYRCLKAFPLDGDSMAWDAVRGDDGAWRQADSHSVPWTLPMEIRIYGTSAADLESKRAALRTQCLAGGTLTWDWVTGSRSYTIWAGQPPVVEVNSLYLVKFIALAVCSLTVAPA